MDDSAQQEAYRAEAQPQPQGHQGVVLGGEAVRLRVGPKRQDPPSRRQQGAQHQRRNENYPLQPQQGKNTCFPHPGGQVNRCLHQHIQQNSGGEHPKPHPVNFPALGQQALVIGGFPNLWLLHGVSSQNSSSSVHPRHQQMAKHSRSVGL